MATTSERRSTVRSGLLGPLPIAMLLLALVWHLLELRRRPFEPLPTAPTASSVAVMPTPTPLPKQRPPAVLAIDVERLIESRIRPAFDACREADRQAVDDCVRRLRERFSAYRKGIEAFADELTWHSTRFGIATRSPGDWWYEDGRLREYVSRIFEKHVFASEELESDLVAALSQLRDATDANRARLLLRLRIALDTERASRVMLPTSDDLRLEVAREIERAAADQGQAALYDEGVRLLVTETASLV
ncbi:MAG TPA: hypothetical protein DCQ98_19975, partial [Planctomycetaceae bacterium]|nr:hypothetical protein [Planctomycetaceae bacterium]HRF00071.1 hypothetical protein [Pirellulaceae bacterium]